MFSPVRFSGPDISLMVALVPVPHALQPAWTGILGGKGEMWANLVVEQQEDLRLSRPGTREALWSLSSV